MIFTVTYSKGARKDHDRLLSMTHGDVNDRVSRALRDLFMELKVDGWYKGASQPSNPFLRRFEEEQGMLAVIFDVSRAIMDRYIEIKHIIPLVPLAPD